MTADEALEAVKKDGKALKDLSEQQRNNPTIVKLAVEQHGPALKHASDELKGDRTIVMAAVSQRGQWSWRALSYASPEMQKDREVVMAAVQHNGSALQFAAPVLKGDRGVVLKAVAQNGDALKHALEQLRANRAVVLEAVAQDGSALEYASAELRGDRGVVWKACTCYRTFSGYLLKCASDELKGDRDFMLEAVKQDYSSLEYASEQLRGDREVVLEAVTQKGSALKYASEQLRGDREVVLEAVKQDGSALKYASEELRGDREVVLEAVTQDGSALEYASEELRGDHDAVLEAVKQDGSALKYASEELRGDHGIVLRAVKESSSLLELASEQLQGDRDFMLAVVEHLIRRRPDDGSCDVDYVGTKKGMLAACEFLNLDKKGNKPHLAARLEEWYEAGGEGVVQEEAEADPRLIEQRDALSSRINAQLDLTDLHLDLPELRKAIDELNQLYSDTEDALRHPPDGGLALAVDLVTRAEARYAKVKDEQSPAAERKLEGLFGPSVLEHTKRIFEDAPSDFDATIADAQRLGLDAERIAAAKDLEEKAEASASALRDATRLDSRVSAFLVKACEALLDFGIDSLENLGSLGSNIGEFQDVQSLSDDFTAVLLDKELLRGEGLKKRDVQIRLRGLLSLCWLPPGVNADESIKLLRGCDRNYENEEDAPKLSEMKSLKHGCFMVAKAAHVTDKLLDAANDPVANDPGFLFIKACFEQLQPPREPDVTIAKHHNMLRLVGPSKSGKSELAKLLARLYVASVDKPEDRLEGRWLEMDQILPDTSERSIWVAEVLGQPIKIWGPLKYLWHLAKKKPKARFALIMPEANRGDLFNILNRHWFEPRNRLGVSASKLPDAAPPANLCIIFTENPVTANGAYQVMGGDEALGTRLTLDQTAAVEHGRVIDHVPVGKVEDGLCNPKLRFDMSNFAQFFVRNHHVDAADANDLAWLASTSEWKSTFDSADPATTMPDFFEMTSKLHWAMDVSVRLAAATEVRQRFLQNFKADLVYIEDEILKGYSDGHYLLEMKRELLRRRRSSVDGGAATAKA